MDDNVYVARRSDGSTKIESIFSIIQKAVKNNHSLVDLFNVDEETSIPKSDAHGQEINDYLYTNTEYEMEVAGFLHKDGSEYTATISIVYIDLGSNNDDMTEQFEQLIKELNDDLSA